MEDKPGFVLIGGREKKHTSGYYEPRLYEGDKPVYQALPGASPTEAESMRKKKAADMSARVIAKKAGVQVVPIDPQRKTLSVQLSRFIASKVARGSFEAAEVYKLAGEEFLQVIGRQYADEILPEDITKFHRALQQRGMSKRTGSNRHASVRAFLIYLGKDTKILPKPPKFDKTMPEIYTDEELAALFTAVTAPRENLLYRVLLQTGLREQGAMFLEWSDVYPERKTLKLQSKVERWGLRLKDFEERELPLNQELIERLMEYKKTKVGTDSLIFPNDGGSDGHFLRKLKQVVRDAGIACGRCDGSLAKRKECENWYLHKFRATFCTTLLRTNELDIRTIQQMMGHDDLRSTLRYLRPAEGRKVQAVINSISGSRRGMSRLTDIEMGIMIGVQLVGN